MFTTRREQKTKFDQAETEVLDTLGMIKNPAGKIYSLSLKNISIKNIILGLEGNEKIGRFIADKYTEKKKTAPEEQFRLALRKLAAGQEEDARKDFTTVQEIKPKDAKLTKICTDIDLLTNELAKIQQVAANLEILDLKASWKLEYVNKKGAPTPDPLEGTLSLCLVPQGRGRNAIFSPAVSELRMKKSENGQIYSLPISTITTLNSLLEPKVEKRKKELAEQEALQKKLLPENRFREALNKLQAGKTIDAKRDFATIKEMKAEADDKLFQKICADIGIVETQLQNINKVAAFFQSLNLHVDWKLDYFDAKGEIPCL